MKDLHNELCKTWIKEIVVDTLMECLWISVKMFIVGKYTDSMKFLQKYYNILGNYETILKLV